MGAGDKREEAMEGERDSGWVETTGDGERKGGREGAGLTGKPKLAILEQLWWVQDLQVLHAGQTPRCLPRNRGAQGAGGGCK